MKKTQMKNINSRIDEELFLEIQAVAWLLGISRSDLIREMIQAFCKRGSMKVNGERNTYRELAKVAKEKLADQNMQVGDLIKSRQERETNGFEFDQIVKDHVKSVQSAWKAALKEKDREG